MATLEDSLTPALLKLPIELLVAIASSLRLPNLGRLSQGNHALHSSVRIYLFRYRYSTGILCLPEGLVLQIVGSLDRQGDRNSLVQASLKLYPFVTSYMIRDIVQYSESDALAHAAMNDHIYVAREILWLGGDLNTQARNYNCQPVNPARTPLAVAANNGKVRMVRLLLKVGAG
jgi:hypothetical protein